MNKFNNRFNTAKWPLLIATFLLASTFPTTPTVTQAAEQTAGNTSVNTSASVTAPTLSAGFTDELNQFDPVRWYKANGWGNGPGFGAGWRADHIEFLGDDIETKNKVMALRLDNDPCPTGCANKAYASGEYFTTQKYGYGRVEARIKAAKGDGLVTSLFTYSGGSGPADEIDIEILGKDTTKLETNYFTNGVSAHGKIIDLGFDASEDFHDYAFEWSATSIKWYVDGKLVHTETGARGPLPTKPSHIMVNLWPGAGPTESWTKPFVYNGKPIRAYYDWIKFTPENELNTPQP
ncbi:family 16 glycosylhydrolase [Paenibacillus sp. 481]|uniref:family 16 glycosylhydrolase n=1 Tax=Paenibacillus sp. 481 TaxID=2835869 RepID=UPI001E63B405|nr:family 16 glycosylhydrolase [Paenibacillus sp. 481]UHA73567.1 family 16 glycosylhydrolase [Paenibacillus sp. 481]